MSSKSKASFSKIQKIEIFGIESFKLAIVENEVLSLLDYFFEPLYRGGENEFPISLYVDKTILTIPKLKPKLFLMSTSMESFSLSTFKMLSNLLGRSFRRMVWDFYLNINNFGCHASVYQA